MSVFERSLQVLLLMFLPLCGYACAGPEATGDEVGESAVESEEVEGEEFALGDEAWLRLQNDSAIYGYVVSIRNSDRTLSPGLFRGPVKLADILTDGTWVFAGDSLPPRVRVIGPGERLEKFRQ